MEENLGNVTKIYLNEPESVGKVTGPHGIQSPERAVNMAAVSKILIFQKQIVPVLRLNGQESHQLPLFLLGPPQPHEFSFVPVHVRMLFQQCLSVCLFSFERSLAELSLLRYLLHLLMFPCAEFHVNDQRPPDTPAGCGAALLRKGASKRSLKWK